MRGGPGAVAAPGLGSFGRSETDGETRQRARFASSLSSVGAIAADQIA
jgi:hypothetical protein